MLNRFFAIALFTWGTVALIAHGGHVNLETKSTKTVVEYGNGYKATWEAEVVNPDKKIVKYTLTLERPKGEKGDEPISLYNLRLQGRLWSVRVAFATQGITFYNSLDEANAGKNPISKNPETGEWLINRAARNRRWFSVEAKPERIAMMVWKRDGTGKDDTCKIEVYSDRRIRGLLSNSLHKDSQAAIAKHMFQNHHSEPPPGTPGGQEGESGN